MLETHGRHLFQCCVTRFMAPLVFEAVEPALGRCIIPTISLVTQRADHIVLFEFALKCAAGGLTVAA